ncbi:transmembrane protein 132C [Sphaeramia orbicularis]|uniref:transmembrane protein 132C n=1 Tax=Sphaeramia orbicularis TaxID=375764 RepID=UPI00117F6290|nr:transmembrane protein 132C-like [Sphaeramia orbicularis]
MGHDGRSAMLRSKHRVKMLLLPIWIFVVVPPALLQPSLPLSLPVHMSVVPPPWKFLPLSQADLGPLFSNSSPFSSSQSLFMVPPPGWASTPALQASFGPYSVTQHISDPALPVSSPLSASLLSEHVERERDEEGRESFRIRALFHKRSDTSALGTCITLHAFKETEEHKASCITQPPLGLCVVTLTLPTHWFEDHQSNQSNQDMDKLLTFIPFRRRIHKRERLRGGPRNSAVKRRHASSLRYNSGAEEEGGFPQALRYRDPTKNQIQLYYSSIETVTNLQFTPPGCFEDRGDQFQRQLFYIKAIALKEEKKDKARDRTKVEETCLNGQEEEEELSLDSHVMIRYHRGPVLIGQPIRVSVNLRANFSAEFVIIRLKVKKGLVSMVAQRTLTSDMWAVTLEKTQGSKHDVVSILCQKHSNAKHTHNPTLLQQVVCLSVDGLRRSFGVAMAVTATWWVEYSGQSHPSLPGTGVSVFSFADRPIIGIAPITEGNTIINTAILTNQPVSLSVIVLAISRNEQVSDVTAAVTCQSTNENIIKVASDCSIVFVDGSESGEGNTCAVVEFFLGTLSGSVCLAVWAPSVPLRVSLADPVLNAIDGWNHFTEDRCLPVYQRSSVQVLTQFTALDSNSRTTHLLNSPDWFVDVTELVRNWLRIEDPRVASLGARNYVTGLQPGKTSLHVVSEQWDGVLGSCDIVVTSVPVTPGDLSVQVVSGLGMTVNSSPAHPSVVTATVTAYNILYNHHQEASISVWLQFSDDTATLLSFFGGIPFDLRLSSLAETVVVVSPGPNQRIFAQGDGGGPLLRAELLVSTCVDQPITSNSLSEDDKDFIETGGRGGTRRLARGSGWIRVNLDLDFFKPVGDKDEEGEDFEFNISDTLAESESDVYGSNFDEENAENENMSTSREYYDKISGRMVNRDWNEVGNGGMISRNNLERAILMPSQEDGAVYFSPSQEKDRGGGEDNEHGALDLEVGVSAVLSLFCLFTVLFLANCLPCALRDRRRRRKMTAEDCDEQLEGDEEVEANPKEEEEEWKKQENGNREEEEIKKVENEVIIEEKTEEKMMDVKQVEIIC